MTIPITDIHTHALRLGAVVAAEPLTELAADSYIYSMGIHPWHTVPPRHDFTLLEKLCGDPRIVAVGECGIDRLKGAPIPRQEDIFRQHIAISERLRKPMIIHCVRAHDIILDIHRETDPRQTWILHGFRRKPDVARQLLDRGIMLSLGPRFNPETACMIPDDRLLIETDDDPTLTIADVAAAVARAREIPLSALLRLIERNTARLFTAIGR